MLDTLKQVLHFVVVAAIFVMFFGLVARSNIRAARIFGWFCIAWALAVAIIEGHDWYSKGDWVITPMQQIWYQIDRSSLNAVESAIGRYISLSAANVMDWILLWPAWFVLGLGGLGFLIFDSRLWMATDKIFIGIVCLGALGLTTDRFFRYVIIRFAHQYGPIE